MAVGLLAAGLDNPTLVPSFSGFKTITDITDDEEGPKANFAQMEAKPMLIDRSDVEKLPMPIVVDTGAKEGARPIPTFEEYIDKRGAIETTIQDVTNEAVEAATEESDATKVVKEIQPILTYEEYVAAREDAQSTSEEKKPVIIEQSNQFTGSSPIGVETTDQASAVEEQSNQFLESSATEVKKEDQTSGVEEQSNQFVESSATEVKKEEAQPTISFEEYMAERKASQMTAEEAAPVESSATSISMESREFDKAGFVAALEGQPTASVSEAAEDAAKPSVFQMMKDIVNPVDESVKDTVEEAVSPETKKEEIQPTLSFEEYVAEREAAKAAAEEQSLVAEQPKQFVESTATEMKAEEQTPATAGEDAPVIMEQTNQFVASSDLEAQTEDQTPAIVEQSNQYVESSGTASTIVEQSDQLRSSAETDQVVEPVVQAKDDAAKPSIVQTVMGIVNPVVDSMKDAVEDIKEEIPIMLVAGGMKSVADPAISEAPQMEPISAAVEATSNSAKSGLTTDEQTSAVTEQPDQLVAAVTTKDQTPDTVSDQYSAAVAVDVPAKEIQPTLSFEEYVAEREASKTPDAETAVSSEQSNQFVESSTTEVAKEVQPTLSFEEYVAEREAAQSRADEQVPAVVAQSNQAVASSVDGAPMSVVESNSIVEPTAVATGEADTMVPNSEPMLVATEEKLEQPNPTIVQSTEETKPDLTTAFGPTVLGSLEALKSMSGEASLPEMKLSDVKLPMLPDVNLAELKGPGVNDQATVAIVAGAGVIGAGILTSAIGAAFTVANDNQEKRERKKEDDFTVKRMTAKSLPPEFQRNNSSKSVTEKLSQPTKPAFVADDTNGDLGSMSADAFGKPAFVVESSGTASLFNTTSTQTPMASTTAQATAATPSSPVTGGASYQENTGTPAQPFPPAMASVLSQSATTPVNPSSPATGGTPAQSYSPPPAETSSSSPSWGSTGESPSFSGNGWTPQPEQSEDDSSDQGKKSGGFGSYLDNL